MSERGKYVGHHPMNIVRMMAESIQGKNGMDRDLQRCLLMESAANHLVRLYAKLYGDDAIVGGSKASLDELEVAMASLDDLYANTKE